MTAPQPKQPRCPWGQHQWRDAPVKDRPGWVATYCVVCGKWLGCRPASIQGGHPGQRWVGGSYE